MTRLQCGYRIRLSDTEYEGLSALLALAEADVQAMEEWDWRTTFDARERRGIKNVLAAGPVEDRRTGQ